MPAPAAFFKGDYIAPQASYNSSRVSWWSNVNIRIFRLSEMIIRLLRISSNDFSLIVASGKDNHKCSHHGDGLAQDFHLFPRIFLYFCDRNSMILS